MASSSEFDKEEVREIERLSKAMGTASGRGAGGVSGSSKTNQALAADHDSRTKVAAAALKAKIKFEKIEDTGIQKLKDAERKEGDAQKTAAQNAQKAFVNAETQRVDAKLAAGSTGARGLLRRGGALAKSTVTGALIGLVPAPALRVAAAFQQGAIIAGKIGGFVAAGASIASQLVIATVREIVLRREEQQEIIRRRRGLETLRERKARAFNEFGTTGDFATFIGAGAELVSIKIKEELTSKYAAFEKAVKSFGVKDGVDFAWAMAKIGIAATAVNATSRAASYYGGKLGFEIPAFRISREDELRFAAVQAVEPGNVMALVRDSEKAHWKTMGINTHPAAGVLMDKMRQRIDIMLSGKGFSGGWKKEPPTPEQEK